jgi:hypothetical protein
MSRRLSGGVFTIKPYLWRQTWVFDDPEVGLDKEPLVDGMPELIREATADILDAESGFVARFAARPFAGAEIVLERCRPEAGGAVYRWEEAGLEGWLCPALFRYFDEAPPRLYVQVAPLDEA